MQQTSDSTQTQKTEYVSHANEEQMRVAQYKWDILQKKRSPTKKRQTGVYGPHIGPVGEQACTPTV